MKSGITQLTLAALVLSLSAASLAQSSQPKNKTSEKEVRELSVKTQTLINLLVKRGVIDAETARALTLHAEQEVAKEYGAVTDLVPESEKDKEKATEPGVVRVPYVSQHLRNQIREEVRKDLQQDVVEDVIKKAEKERWGVPGAWPAWLSDVKLSGDIRTRFDAISFADENSNQYLDFLAINRAGGTIPAGRDAFLNTTEDIDRLVVRARLGIDIKVAPHWDAGFRFTTGKANNPVSGDLTLSNNMSGAEVYLSRAFIAYHSTEKQIQFYAGKFANPWLSTDLVWDEDLSFGGVALSYAPMRELNEKGQSTGFDPFITLGAFPLDEISDSNNDKWLYGAQTGVNYVWSNDSKLKIGIAYYDFENIEGQFNSVGSDLLDFTAPRFMQKGNTLFDIRNDQDNESQLAALASDYNEMNFTIIYDIANFNPIHLVFIADYVKNTGFNARERLQEFSDQTGIDFNQDAIKENVDGYKFEVQVGHNEMQKRHDWNASIGYRSLEANAVVDAFTDSTFHLGGTDGEGYIASVKYGVAKNTWLNLRTLSSNEIDGPPLGVDIWQLDLIAKF